MKNIFRRAVRGFTLIELLIVISIIALLAAVILVALNGARQKGNNGRIEEDVTQIRSALELTRTTTGKYPSSALDSNQSGTNYNAAIEDANSLTEATDIAHLNGGTILSNGGSIPVTTGIAVFIDVYGTNVPASKYAIFGVLGPVSAATGYFCVDSSGNNVTHTGVPPWALIGTNSKGTCI